MNGFGVCIAERSFECLLCQRQYTRVSGDLILTEDLICNDCLKEFQRLDESELRKQVSDRLSKNPSLPSQEIERALKIIQQSDQRGRGEKQS